MPIGAPLITLNLRSQTMVLPESRMQVYGGLVLSDYRLREIFPYRTPEQLLWVFPVCIRRRSNCTARC